MVAGAHGLLREKTRPSRKGRYAPLSGSVLGQAPP